MINILKHLFHFFGGIYFAIILIALTAIIVAIGTFIESQTASHLFAAQWTFENSFFILLLSLFFINILFSALRRWPFKKRHIPFLITHLGLLMIISGTILKNHFGLQGLMSVWEGSGNQNVLIPHTYALHIETADPLASNKQSSLPLNSFHQSVHYPFHFPTLKCKLMSYAPHVKHKLVTWIKHSNVYIAGFPRIPVHQWEPTHPFPTPTLHGATTLSSSWSMVALRTSHVQAALQQAYLQELSLKIKSKNLENFTKQIPLQQATSEGVALEQGILTISLSLPSSFEDNNIPSLNLDWQPHHHHDKERLTIPLQGQDALAVKNETSKWFESPLIIDLSRPHPTLCFIEDDQEQIHLFAFDPHGRVWVEHFNPHQLNSLISYDQGFGGYSVQTKIPFPNFPTGREDKEKAEAYELTLQLQEALLQPSSLTPPLQLLKQACQKAGTDLAETFVQFLMEWNANHALLFHSRQPLSESLKQVLVHLDWKEVPPNDQQAMQWMSRILAQLDGENPLTILKNYHWPFLSEFQQQGTLSFPNLLAQQISTIVSYLPPLHISPDLSLNEQAHLLSAYFRLYGIDYRSFFPFRQANQEQFDYLERYWKTHSSEEKEMKQFVTFETPLTQEIIPEERPSKLEDQSPGIILEMQQGLSKQVLALAYDKSAVGLKWPILNGKYLIRFQPKLEKIPYRIRLREARQIFYPQTQQVYSYESDLLIKENDRTPIAQTLSMNHVHETWEGYRFYLSGVGTSADSDIKHIQLAVNYDPAKYLLTYPGAILVFIGVILLFWVSPYLKS